MKKKDMLDLIREASSDWKKKKLSSETFCIIVSSLFLTEVPLTKYEKRRIKEISERLNNSEIG